MYGFYSKTPPRAYIQSHAITRLSCWARNGGLGRICAVLQESESSVSGSRPYPLDSTVVKVRPDGTGGFDRLDRMVLAFVPVTLILEVLGLCE